MEKHKETFKIIGLNVKKDRKEAKLTQQNLGDRAMGDRAKISDIENGKENFMLSTLLDIAEGLNIDVKKLFILIKESNPISDELSSK